MIHGLAGFNGQRADPVSGTSHPGNGYRSYHPVLQRFTAPDSLSPYGAGGVNSYAYCVNDPVNKADPSGHLSTQAWLGIGMGIAGLGLAIFSAGASIAAAGGVMAAVESASSLSLVTGAAGIVSDVTAIASGALEGGKPQASAALGWVSLAAGIIGIAQGLAGKLAGGSNRPFRALMAGEAVATGQFRHPRFLGASTGDTPGFDFMFEDTNPQGLRRLNIVTQGEIEYGNNPTLRVNLWNEAHSTNQVVHYSPDTGAESVLDGYFLDENGQQYPVYRLGIGYAANTRRQDGNWIGLFPRGFAKQFSTRMRGSSVEVSRKNVLHSGPAVDDIRYAATETYNRAPNVSHLEGQEILNLVNTYWGEHAGAFEMTSDGWMTYFNGRSGYRYRN